MKNLYGLTKTNLFLAKGMNERNILFPEIKNLKSLKGLTDDSEIQAVTKTNNEIIEKQLGQVKESVLMSNELNTALINVLSDIDVHDGLDLTEPDYSVFEIEDKEFGDLALFYGLDIAKIGFWKGDVSPETDYNPQFIPSTLNTMNVEDRLKVSYRNNASVYKGAFQQANEQDAYISLENKRGKDTLRNRMQELIGQDIKSNVTRAIHIPGFDTKENTIESTNIINEFVIKMTQKNRSFNAKGHLRAAGKTGNLVMIIGSKYMAQSSRDYATTYTNSLINTETKIGKVIFDDSIASNNVFVMDKSYYKINKKIDTAISQIEPETLNTLNWLHTWLRRAAMQDQQAIVFTNEIEKVAITQALDGASLTLSSDSATALDVYSFNLRADGDAGTVLGQVSSATPLVITLPDGDTIIKVVDANGKVLEQYAYIDITGSAIKATTTKSLVQLKAKPNKKATAELVKKLSDQKAAEEQINKDASNEDEDANNS